MTDDETDRTNAIIRELRATQADHRRRAEEIEARIAQLLRAAGRRADADDQQPALFDPAAQPRLW